MPYGVLKVDTVTFTSSGVDKSVTLSGLVQNPTFSGTVTSTSTISGVTIQGGTLVSGATVTGSVGQFTSLTAGTVTLTSGVFASGTAAAPSVSIGTSTNGLYSPGADQLAISTAGTGRVFINSTGSLGVGTPLTYSSYFPNAAVFNNQGVFFADGSINYFRTGFGNNALPASPDGYINMRSRGWGLFAIQDDVLTYSSGPSGTAGSAAAGSERFRITSDGKLGIGTSYPDALLTVNGVGAFGAGSAAAPSIAITGDLNTGIYSPGADQLAISTGGTGRLFIDSGGGVGINRPPSATFGAYSSDKGIELGYSTTYVGGYIQAINRGAPVGSIDLLYYLDGTATHRFFTAATERLRITSDGKVGIGTSSPGDILELQGGKFRISANSAQYHTIDYSSNNLVFTANAGAANQASDFVFSSSLSGGAIAERLRITSDGKVGIGTTSPQSLVDVAGSNGRLQVVNGAASNGMTLRATNSAFNANGFLSFEGYSYEYGRFDSSGRLLVGTTSDPGGIDSRLAVSNATDTRFMINTTGLASTTEIHFRNTNSNGEARITNNTGGPLTFYKNLSTEVARIDSSGLLLVGTSTATANGGVLQVSNGITFPGTQSACSDPNTLDDYEEGTFTPTIIGTGTQGTGTYTTQLGRYTKVGNRVHITIYLNWSAHTGTGNMYVATLPFSSNSTSNNYSSMSIWHSSIALTAGNVMQAYSNPGTTQIALSQVATGGGTSALVPIDTAGEIIVTGTYET